MRKKSSISLGPGASSLILIFVMLSLSVLAMLALSSGYHDRQMSLRSARISEEIYALYEQAEETREKIGETLGECMETSADETQYLRAAAEALTGIGDGIVPEENVVSWEEKDGVYTLQCAVSIGSYGQKSDRPGIWRKHILTADRTQSEEEWDEWN